MRQLGVERRTSQVALSHEHRLSAMTREHFDVILGLNEKEAHEIATTLDIENTRRDRDGLVEITQKIAAQVPVSTVVVHPVSYALACSNGQCAIVDGPFVAQPLITTGAGDHFNAGFCLGKLLGLRVRLRDDYELER